MRHHGATCEPDPHGRGLYTWLPTVCPLTACTCIGTRGGWICACTLLNAGAGLSRDELVSLIREGARYALAADSDDATEAMPRMYFLAWGLEPFIPKVCIIRMCVEACN